MALPGAIEKRNLLYATDPKRPFDAFALGDEFFALGRFSEALDFYLKVEDTARRQEAFGRTKKQAVATGNAFILGRLAQAGETITKDDYRATAHAARAQGSLRYALRAAIAAGEEALVAELRATLGDAVPAALAAQAESPEQAKAGATTPGQKVEAVAATGAAHAHEPTAARPAPAPAPGSAGDGAAPSAPPEAPKA